MELGVEAARWMIGKALGPVSGGVLEAWAASTELGGNIEALRMELLYAEGMLNNARGHGHGPGIKNPALSELLHKLRELAYRADDALDEVDYFRIQDELDGTYHAAEEHDGGCLRTHALNARHAARAIANMLGFSKCSSACFANIASHGKPHEDTASTKRVPPCGGHWPCTGGVKASEDDDDGEEESKIKKFLFESNDEEESKIKKLFESNDEEEDEEDPKQGGVCWPCPTDQLVNNGCMSRITSAASSTIHTVGKHLPLPCYSSVSSGQNAANSNATSTGRRFLCCARANNKAPQRERALQTSELKFDRVEMSRKMKDITEQLKPLCAKVSTILNLELLAANLNSNNSQYMATGRPITTSESIEPKIFGRDEVTSKVINDITTGEYSHKNLTVLPIVGPGGIGKTTFTQHIYKKLHDHFEVKLWVCVSVNFSASRLTQEVADKIKKEGNASPESRIEEGIKSKRFLLVLDDMWSCSNEDEWKRFLVPFDKGQKEGSVILVTTRFPALAQMVKTTHNPMMELKGIDEEEFEKLFLAYVFGNNGPTQDQSKLLDSGREIIKKLKGSPLAAKTVGRLLRNHLDLGHWTRVLESREWESQSGDHDIMPALKLSFDYLPFHLQQCFTYCSLFPEDYKFSEEEIIHFWIGLDVLHSRGENKKAEDIGLSYLIELINHGFFKKEEYDDGLTYYVIHDLMHELGLKVSADECLSLYSSNVRSIQIRPSIRHLSINIDDSSVNDRKAFDTCKEDFSMLGERLRVENLHSLMLFGKCQGSFAKTLHGLFSKAKSLRVILISGGFYSMEDLLHSFPELIHLRYLRVHDNWLYGESNKLVASSSVSRFYHMRVLDLRGCQDSHNLKGNMTKLVKLRHFPGGVHSWIAEVGKLKSLQELTRFEVRRESHGFELSQIGHLLELCGSLSIDNLENVEGRDGADEAKLMHKKNLNELILNWKKGMSNKDPQREEQVLEGLKPHSNLQKLSIRGHGGGTCPSWLGPNLSVHSLESLSLDSVDWKTFPPIGDEFQLVNMGDEGKLGNSRSQHFMNLKRIELAGLKRLERWVVGGSGELLSHLEVLIIKFCPELVELAFSDSKQDRKAWPLNLRELVIKYCPKMSSMPPVPWRSTPCSVEISQVGLGFGLRYGKFYFGSTTLALEIVNLDSSAPFWRILDFNNLKEVKEFRIEARHAFDGRLWMKPRGTSGKELTQVLSYMPKLSGLSIEGCEKITGLGVVEQQEAVTACYSSRSREEEEEIEAAEEGLLLLPLKLQKLRIQDCPELSLRPLHSGLQTLCSLSSLTIFMCPKFFSCYIDKASSSSSSFPLFPTSLQSLFLYGMDLRGVSLGPHGCLQKLTVVKTTNSFFSGPESSILSSSIHLSSLETDDVAGALAAPICRFLSSSLTKLFLRKNEEMECFTEEQDQALQLLTSLQHLKFDHCEKLQSLPAGLHRLTSLETLEIEFCPSIRLRLLPKNALPNSLQKLTISFNSAIRTLPKDGLPDSLQELHIQYCPSIRALPKGGLPTSLKLLEVSGGSEDLKRQCSNLVGTVPIVKLD
ncbi:hypothetical protein BDA96_02G168100 [Sorghum bicolor]|jgi:hypothetical protein|uniref:AAA+ ATPase domain-containing protein n=2 Tax=Sorghum bicolor TaxID=4558 RepID=C5X8Z4_SORBI|nr:putative disease resistance protein RGA4 [Sorghum bicolor]XP_021308886.1 putative disease resistance protein RGA4 [Sorghum bicolor]XP_021308887.1 putative disease resistance protein RGA4 [Sorghum bicolor]XP_021308888.1 putative disease resistance protein RGA4 [Sorghum bicolor]XP_021308889.1 putative disease resistance protein RGA4 [Sorghum bicolor]XP_021308890.1 putative disease resistance protein RGA4 [Sorghum bicolor]XP_021308891.1 putative disease resistance protein RGA4 [Sorghum bicolo|eukprot:XP_002460003.1 putative disease resistance protein RGA4 [Sorghum bicolor]